MTFKDLQKVIQSQSGLEQSQQILQRLRGKPFLMWDLKQHRLTKPSYYYTLFFLICAFNCLYMHPRTQEPINLIIKKKTSKNGIPFCVYSVFYVHHPLLYHIYHISIVGQAYHKYGWIILIGSDAHDLIIRFKKILL